MNIERRLIHKADGTLLLESGGRVAEVCTVTEAALTLGRTRRQVYRYIETGLLRPEAKMLGEWLLDAEEVRGAASRPLSVQPLPRRLAPLFPEYDIAALNAGRDRTLVLARVLESGGRADVDWAFRRYSRAELAAFIREDGARLLSPRSLRLWSLVLKVKPGKLPEWRKLVPWDRRDTRSEVMGKRDEKRGGGSRKRVKAAIKKVNARHGRTLKKLKDLP
jgi:hypothetical protein